MRYVHWTLLSVILILAASVVWAQCPIACPQPCPVAMQPCPQACPQACPCPASVPAAMGAGPAAGLQCINCPDFDAAYATEMYAQNSVIIAVTELGMQRANDSNLRDISGEINGYMVSANGKLQGWYGVIACGPVSPNCAEAQAIIAELSAQPASCFDAVYALYTLPTAQSIQRRRHTGRNPGHNPAHEAAGPVPGRQGSRLVIPTRQMGGRTRIMTGMWRDV